ncbi:hypothetical protein D9757_005670 [Collybiopsis confluens]|uniref:Uncharacterized protein n=1 Tax=Collybiopsis confluens TaxID=2823264 RepID=A0A8H5HSM9_9AGAR|nr:hypothetical protein D9757_005670 [Collybiopsis confluens]
MHHPKPTQKIKHNGELTQGAWKTRKGRPWVMQMIVHGFQSKLAALQFEWAWQHPNVARHVRDTDGRVFTSKGRSLKQNIQILRFMISVHPYNLWPLRVKIFTPQALEVWQDLENIGKPLRGRKGKEKADAIRPAILPPGFTYSVELEGVDGKSVIGKGSRRRRAAPIEVQDDNVDSPMIPRGGSCPSCSNYVLWGDVVKGCYRRAAGGALSVEEEEELLDRMYNSDNATDSTKGPDSDTGNHRRILSPRKRRQLELGSGSSDGEDFDFQEVEDQEYSDEPKPRKRAKGRPLPTKYKIGTTLPVPSKALVPIRMPALGSSSPSAPKRRKVVRLDQGSSEGELFDFDDASFSAPKRNVGRPRKASSSRQATFTSPSVAKRGRPRKFVGVSASGLAGSVNTLPLFESDDDDSDMMERSVQRDDLVRKYTYMPEKGPVPMMVHDGRLPAQCNFERFSFLSTFAMDSGPSATQIQVVADNTSAVKVLKKRGRKPKAALAAAASLDFEADTDVPKKRGRKRKAVAFDPDPPPVQARADSTTSIVNVPKKRNRKNGILPTPGHPIWTPVPFSTSEPPLDDTVSDSRLRPRQWSGSKEELLEIIPEIVASDSFAPVILAEAVEGVLLSTSPLSCPDRAVLNLCLSRNFICVSSDLIPIPQGAAPPSFQPHDIPPHFPLNLPQQDDPVIVQSSSSSSLALANMPEPSVVADTRNLLTSGDMEGVELDASLSAKIQRTSLDSIISTNAFPAKTEDEQGALSLIAAMNFAGQENMVPSLESTLSQKRRCSEPAARSAPPLRTKKKLKIDTGINRLSERVLPTRPTSAPRSPIRLRSSNVVHSLRDASTAEYVADNDNRRKSRRISAMSQGNGKLITPETISPHSGRRRLQISINTVNTRSRSQRAVANRDQSIQINKARANSKFVGSAARRNQKAADFSPPRAPKKKVSLEIRTDNIARPSSLGLIGPLSPLTPEDSSSPLLSSLSLSTPSSPLTPLEELEDPESEPSGSKPLDIYQMRSATLKSLKFTKIKKEDVEMELTVNLGSEASSNDVKSKDVISMTSSASGEDVGPETGNPRSSVSIQTLPTATRWQSTQISIAHEKKSRSEWNSAPVSDWVLWNTPLPISANPALPRSGSHLAPDSCDEVTNNAATVTAEDRQSTPFSSQSIQFPPPDLPSSPTLLGSDISDQLLESYLALPGPFQDKKGNSSEHHNDLVSLENPGSISGLGEENVEQVRSTKKVDTPIYQTRSSVLKGLKFSKTKKKSDASASDMKSAEATIMITPANREHSGQLDWNTQSPEPGELVEASANTLFAPNPPPIATKWQSKQISIAQEKRRLLETNNPRVADWFLRNHPQGPKPIATNSADGISAEQHHLRPDLPPISFLASGFPRDSNDRCNDHSVSVADSNPIRDLGIDNVKLDQPTNGEQTLEDQTIPMQESKLCCDPEGEGPESSPSTERSGGQQSPTLGHQHGCNPAKEVVEQVPMILPSDVQVLVDAYVFGLPVMVIASQNSMRACCTVIKLPAEFQYMFMGFFKILFAKVDPYAIAQEERIFRPAADSSAGLLLSPDYNFGRVQWTFGLEWISAGEEGLELPSHVKLDRPWWRDDSSCREASDEVIPTSTLNSSPNLQVHQVSSDKISSMSIPPVKLSSTTNSKDESSPRFLARRQEVVPTKCNVQTLDAVRSIGQSNPLVLPLNIMPAYMDPAITEWDDGMKTIGYHVWGNRKSEDMLGTVDPVEFSDLAVKQEALEQSSVPFGRPQRAMADFSRSRSPGILGMREGAQSISQEKMVVAQHIFTCNDTMLQEEPTELFTSIQDVLILQKAGVSGTPYFSYVAGIVPNDSFASGFTTSDIRPVPWNNVPPCVEQARDLMQHLSAAYGEIAEEFRIDQLTVIGWTATGKKKGASCLRAKEKAIMILSLGHEIGIRIVPKSGFPRHSSANVLKIKHNEITALVQDTHPTYASGIDGSFKNTHFNSHAAVSSNERTDFASSANRDVVMADALLAGFDEPKWNNGEGLSTLAYALLDSNLFSAAIPRWNFDDLIPMPPEVEDVVEPTNYENWIPDDEDLERDGSLLTTKGGAEDDSAARRSSARRQAPAKDTMHFNLLHGDALLLSGDEFEYWIERKGMGLCELVYGTIFSQDAKITVNKRLFYGKFPLKTIKSMVKLLFANSNFSISSKIVSCAKKQKNVESAKISLSALLPHAIHVTDASLVLGHRVRFGPPRPLSGEMETPTAIPRLRVSRMHQPPLSNHSPEPGPSRLHSSSTNLLDHYVEDAIEDDKQDTPRLTTIPIQPEDTPFSEATPAARLKAVLERTSAKTKSSHATVVPSAAFSEYDSDFDIPTIGSSQPSLARETLNSLFTHALRDPGDTPQKSAKGKMRRRNSIDTSEFESSPRVTTAQKDRISDKGKRRSMSDDELSSSNVSTNRSQAAIFDSLRQRLVSGTHRDQMAESSQQPASANFDHGSLGTSQLLDELHSSQLSPPAATSTPQHSLKISLNSQFQSNLLDQDSEMQQAMNDLDSLELSRSIRSSHHIIGTDFGNSNHYAGPSSSTNGPRLLESMAGSLDSAKHDHSEHQRHHNLCAILHQPMLVPPTIQESMSINGSGISIISNLQMRKNRKDLAMSLALYLNSGAQN